MNEAREERGPHGALRRLAAAIREVKTANADRSDVVVELRDTQRARLELLAQELEPVITDIPQDDDRFDFGVVGGLQPRLWVDAVAHVTMGRDKRTYRFLKDTRNGRIVLAETPELGKLADAVTFYIAERIVEREAVLAGDRDIPAPLPVAGPVRTAFEVFTGVALFLAGAFIGVAAVVYFAWGRLASATLGF